MDACAWTTYITVNQIQTLLSCHGFFSNAVTISNHCAVPKLKSSKPLLSCFDEKTYASFELWALKVLNENGECPYGMSLVIPSERRIADLAQSACTFSQATIKPQTHIHNIQETTYIVCGWIWAENPIPQVKNWEYFLYLQRENTWNFVFLDFKAKS